MMRKNKQRRIQLLAGFILCVVFSQAQPFRPQISSPEILPDNRVTFNLLAPNATEVNLVGDWMTNAFTGEKMTKNTDGIWSITTGPLKEDLYRYTYMVNGVTALDPSNIKVLRDDSRYFNYFVVPGNISNLYKMQDVPHGTLSKVWYNSPVFSMKRRMYVYTPPGYESGKEKYPVLYLFHGVSSDEDAWSSIGAAVNILDNLIAQGKAKPMILVMTNGNFHQAVSPDNIEPPQINVMAELYKNAGKFEESIVKDIVPFVDNNYRTLADREHRAIAGLSMGGGQATYTGFNNIDEFAWIGSFSGAFVVWPNSRPAPEINDLDMEAVENIVFPNLDSSINSQMKLVYLAIGTKDPLIEPQRKFKNWLNEKNIQFEDVETEGYAHVWNLWRINLVEFASKIFK